MPPPIKPVAAQKPPVEPQVPTPPPVQSGEDDRLRLMDETERANYSTTLRKKGYTSDAAIHWGTNPSGRLSGK